MTSGIYAITNTVTGEQYIGASRTMEVRKVAHWADLRAGRGVNQRLQEAWDTHGAEAFVFVVLEEVEDVRLSEKEREHIAHRPHQYNHRPGGNGLFLHERQREGASKDKVRMTFVLPPREDEMFQAIMRARYPYEAGVHSLVFRQMVREEFARIQQAQERKTSNESAGYPD